MVMVVIAALAAAGMAGGDRAGRGTSISGGVSARVPVRWHILRGWLSDVVDPAPRLAVASFPARLSRRTCACGFPNVVNFPRDGAFVFVWEYLHPTRRELVGIPSRPTRFHLAADARVRKTCAGSSDTYAFKDAGRVFQVEVYLGPDAGPALRGRAATMLASLRAAPAA
jgi:hypothetical protein